MGMIYTMQSKSHLKKSLFGLVFIVLCVILLLASKPTALYDNSHAPEQPIGSFVRGSQMDTASLAKNITGSSDVSRTLTQEKWSEDANIWRNLGEETLNYHNSVEKIVLPRGVTVQDQFHQNPGQNSKDVQNEWHQVQGKNWNVNISKNILQDWLSDVDTLTTNILTLEKLPFLPNFKNPCWLEKFVTSNPYKGLRHNINFLIGPPINQRLKTMREVLASRYTSGHPYRLRCLPYYFIIGPQKTGTTDLHEKLNLHPDMEPGLLKESHWWSRSRIYKEMNTTLTEYIDLYDYAAEAIANNVLSNTSYHPQITGDSTPETIWDNWYWRDQPENRDKEIPALLTPHYIHHVLPGAKIIAMLRDPTDRLVSDFKYFTGGQDATNFHFLVTSGIQWLEECYNSQKPREVCIYDQNGDNRPFGKNWNPVVRLRMGLYSEFLEDWLKVFPEQQFKIVRMEDYSEDRIGVLNDIYNFLGLENLPTYIEKSILSLDDRISNQGLKSKSFQMLPKTEKALKKFYEPFNKKLSKMLNNAEFLWGS